MQAGGAALSSIGPGLVVLLGVGQGDDEGIADRMAARLVSLRVFPDAAGKTNLSILDVAGDVMVISQFTLYADSSRGRRPSFAGAAPAGQAERLYQRVAQRMSALGVAHVATGRFGARMAVDLVNDGPFTLWLDSGTTPSRTGRT